jgi:PKD repeat protein
MRVREYFVGLISLVGTTLAAQPSADFSLPFSACLNESIKITNQSQNTIAYQWDFCQGDLARLPIAQNLGGSLVASNSPRIKMVYDGTNWFGFVVSRANNNILRLAFGTSIDNPSPIVTDLGNMGNASLSPVDIDVVFSNGNWYGFVLGDNTAVITRIDFGASLATSPSILLSTTLLTGIAQPTYGGGLHVTFDFNSNLWYLVFTGIYSINVVRLATIESVPTLADNISTGNVPVFSYLSQIKTINSNGIWYAYTVSVANSKLYKLTFGPSLFASPTYQDITGTWIGSSTPTGLAVGWDNGAYYLMVGTSGGLARVTLGGDLSNVAVPTGIFLGGLSVLQQINKMDMVKHNGVWRVFICATFSSDLYRITFPHINCGVPNSSLTEPVITYSTSGSQGVTLRAYSDAINFIEVNKATTISSLSAPPISITYSNSCVSSMIEFTYLSPHTVSTFNWNFGDNNSSSSPNPSHLYALANRYLAELSVTGSNGCSNYTSSDVDIYNPPSPAFDLPTGLICTNNEFTFANTTTDNFDGHLSYEWFVNDVAASASRDLKFAFSSIGDQQVKLKTSIPGCSTELVQTLVDVKSGPTVAFDFAGKCEDENIVFTNRSIGPINGYQWNFDDGNTSTAQSTSHVFPDPASYDVSLQTIGTNGCTSTLTKTVNVYSVPQTNFSIELPPFSCAGTPSQFNDLTPPMPESNIATWVWAFGDPANGVSSQKNPLYTYSASGNYFVSLSTTTNFGCTNFVQKSITISPSPKADFSFGPACVNQATQFTDQSTGDVKLWLWSVQNKTYSIKNAQHIFSSPAIYNTTLTVTAGNNCISQVSKNAIVPVPVAPDFTAQATCATKSSLFQAVNPTSADPVSSWAWDFGGQGTGTGLSSQHIFPLVGNYSVKMTTTRQSGCTYSISKTIPVIAPPKASFSVFLNDGPAPFTVDFVNTSSQATSFEWKFGDAGNSTSTLFSPSFTYLSLGNFTAQLMAGNTVGCTDTYTQPINVVVPNMNASITNFDLKKISTGWGPVVTIKNESNIALIDPDIYLDISGSALINEKIVAVIKPGASFTHTFASTVSPRSFDYACAEIKINADTYLYDNRQCVNVADQFISMAPYPNPANAELVIEWINQRNDPMEIVIYSSSGQVALRRQYTSSQVGLNQVQVDITGLQAGIYLVSYMVDGVAQNFRFSVIR